MLKEAIKILQENNLRFSASVAKTVNGGFLLETEDEAFDGARIFLPGSHSRWDKCSVENVDTFMVSILKFEPKRGQIIVSARDAMKDLSEKEKLEFMESLCEGMVIKGIVRDINEFGVFVNIGRMDALLHDSEANNEYTKGNIVELEVKFVDFRRVRVSLIEKGEC